MAYKQRSHRWAKKLFSLEIYQDYKGAKSLADYAKSKMDIQTINST